MFQFFKNVIDELTNSKSPFTEFEQQSIDLITNLLNQPDTSVIFDVWTDKYSIHCTRLNIKVEIVGQSSMIRITNSIGPIAEKIGLSCMKLLKKQIQSHQHEKLLVEFSDTDTRIVNFVKTLNSKFS